MKYEFCTKVRDDDALRESFNELTQKTFCFNFRSWYKNGNWGDVFIPHVLVDHGKVVSNVSVNLMNFNIGGDIKNYIQLGTVMTDQAYRGQGLNRYIMERVFEEYHTKVDGIFLFGNDSVLKYYPKFGFKQSKEYVYTAGMNQGTVDNSKCRCVIKKVDLSDSAEAGRFFAAMKIYQENVTDVSPTEGFRMYGNPGLIQFWLGSYKENLYYIPEKETYVFATEEDGILNIHQLIGFGSVNIKAFAATLAPRATGIRLLYTPADKTGYTINPYKEEDCTLFVYGEDLKRIEADKMHFQTMSHA